MRAPPEFQTFLRPCDIVSFFDLQSIEKFSNSPVVDMSLVVFMFAKVNRCTHLPALFTQSYMLKRGQSGSLVHVCFVKLHFLFKFINLEHNETIIVSIPDISTVPLLR